MKLKRQEAYDQAVAVLGPKVRFVEWKMYEVDSAKPPYFPYDIKGVRSWDTTADIAGARWIYAFRRQASDPQNDGHNPSPAQLVDEIYRDDHGKLHVTPTSKLLGARGIVERNDRGEPVEIGDTIAFARQLFGHDLDHFFFAARIRLPSDTLLEIGNRIPLWTARIRFIPNDPNIIWATSDDVPLVPVLDPLMIARYLHTYYIAAENDLMKYLAPFDDPDDPDAATTKKRARERQRQVMLSELVDALLDVDSGNLGTRSKVSPDQQDKLFDFRTDYVAQVDHRVKWRDRWAKYLANWLQSEAIAALAAAYAVDEVNEFPIFFVAMALCHWRLSETQPGRELLKLHFEAPKRFGWVQKYVFGREGELSGDVVQALRKTGSSALELIREHIPVWMAEKRGAVIADEVAKQLGIIYGHSVEFVHEFKLATDDSLFMAWIKKAGARDEMKFLDMHEVKLLAEQRVQPLEAKWKGAVATMAAGLELINFALTIKSFGDHWSGADLLDKILGFVNLAGAGLDFAGAGIAMLDLASEHTLAKMGFVSGVIDGVLAEFDLVKALRKGNMKQAAASAVISVGSFAVAYVTLADPELLPVAVFVVAIGYFLKVLFGDDNDYQLFVAHTLWGDSYGSGDDKPGWYETDETFADWRGDLDEQLRAGVMLVCRFKVDPDADDGLVRYRVAVQELRTAVAYAGSDDKQEAKRAFAATLRKFTLRMGWIPPNAKLEVNYVETWSNGLRSHRGSIDFARPDEKPKSDELRFDIRDTTTIDVEPTGALAPLYDATSPTLVDGKLLNIAVRAWLTVEVVGRKHTIYGSDGLLYASTWKP